MVGKLAGRLGPEDRDLEGMTLHGGQLGQLVRGHLRQEIRQPAEGQAPLRFGRRRAEDARTAVARPPARFGPDARLADPGVPDEEEARQAAPRSVDEAVDRLELAAAADQVTLGHPTPAHPRSRPCTYSTARVGGSRRASGRNPDILESPLMRQAKKRAG